MNLSRMFLSWFYPAILSAAFVYLVIMNAPVVGSPFIFIPLTIVSTVFFRMDLLDTYGVHTTVSYTMVIKQPEDLTDEQAKALKEYNDEK